MNRFLALILFTVTFAASAAPDLERVKMDGDQYNLHAWLEDFDNPQYYSPRYYSKVGDFTETSMNFIRSSHRSLPGASEILAVPASWETWIKISQKLLAALTLEFQGELVFKNRDELAGILRPYVDDQSLLRSKALRDLIREQKFQASDDVLEYLENLNEVVKWREEVLATWGEDWDWGSDFLKVFRILIQPEVNQRELELEIGSFILEIPSKFSSQIGPGLELGNRIYFYDFEMPPGEYNVGPQPNLAGIEPVEAWFSTEGLEARARAAASEMKAKCPDVIEKLRSGYNPDYFPFYIKEKAIARIEQERIKAGVIASAKADLTRIEEGLLKARDHFRLSSDWKNAAHRALRLMTLDVMQTSLSLQDWEKVLSGIAGVTLDTEARVAAENLRYLFELSELLSRNYEGMYQDWHPDSSLFDLLAIGRLKADAWLTGFEKLMMRVQKDRARLESVESRIRDVARLDLLVREDLEPRFTAFTEIADSVCTKNPYDNYDLIDFYQSR